MIEVVRIEEIIEEGVTEPIRCTLSDGNDAIVKYPMNRFGIGVLVNEWIGNSIAKAIGLMIPQYGVCNLSKEVIIRDRETDDLRPENAGTCFYSRIIKNTSPITDILLESVKNKETERIMLFDFITNDKDRHNGNIIISNSPEIQMYFIDCSHIFANVNHTLTIELKEELSENCVMSVDMLCEDKGIYKRLSRHVGFSSEELLRESRRIKEILTDKKLCEIRDSVPNEWISESMNNRINDIFMILRIKIQRIEEIAKRITDEGGF